MVLAVWQPYSFWLLFVHLDTISFWCFPLSSSKGRRPVSVERPECKDKRKMRWENRVVWSTKSIKRQVGEDTGALCGHSGWLHCCAPCSQSFALASDLWHCFISFLRTNVLDTRDHLRFAGIYQEVLSASWAAAETNMKKERIPSKKKKKYHHQKLLRPIIPLNYVTFAYEPVFWNKTSGCGMRWKPIEPVWHYFVTSVYKYCSSATYT